MPFKRKHSSAERRLALTKLSTADATSFNWLTWFLTCLGRAIAGADEILAAVLAKHAFWERHRTTTFNARQRVLVTRLLDGYEGKLSTRKAALHTKTSHDTALRDIEDLVRQGILKKEKAGGRSTSYSLATG